MDSSKLIRVCVAGIHFRPHEFDFESSTFSHKHDMDFVHAAAERYCSNMIRFGEFANKKGRKGLEYHYEASCDQPFRDSFAE